MRRHLNYRNYNAEVFGQDHPEDPWLPEAEIAAAREAERASGPRDGERARDAKHRIDEAFEGLDMRLAERMEEYGRGEAAFMRTAFIERETQEIWNRHLPGIETGTTLEHRDVARFARDEEIRLFRERINDNPTLLKERQQLADMQAVRSTAVSALIGRLHDATLQRLGLERADDVELAQEPPVPKAGKDAERTSFDALVRQAQEKERERDTER